MTEIPYVPKRNVTLIAIADPLEATAVRAVLEGLNYRTSSHWVGSRAEAIKLLTGEIPTDQVVIVSCHGDEHGILLPDEDPITPGDVRDHACLEGKPSSTSDAAPAPTTCPPPSVQRVRRPTWRRLTPRTEPPRSPL